MPDEISEQPALPLPGLEEPGTANVSPLVRALRRSIVALDQEHLLTEAHALDLAAAHLLARAAEMKLATGRASTISNDVDLLLRIKQNIVTPPESGDASSIDEKLRKAMEDFEAELAKAGS